MGGASMQAYWGAGTLTKGCMNGVCVESREGFHLLDCLTSPPGTQ